MFLQDSPAKDFKLPEPAPRDVTEGRRAIGLALVLNDAPANVGVKAGQVRDGGMLRVGLEGVRHVHKLGPAPILRLWRLRHNTANTRARVVSPAVGTPIPVELSRLGRGHEPRPFRAVVPLTDSRYVRCSWRLIIFQTK